MNDVDAVVTAAHLLSDLLRLRIIMLLETGPMTVNELTARTGALQPRVSSHLALLRQAGWVKPSSHGQQRRYHIVSPRIPEVIHSLGSMPNASSQQSPKNRQPHRTTKMQTLRRGRTCYKHLAGQAGVALCKRLRDNGWIVPTENKIGKYQPAYALTEVGQLQLRGRGVVIPEESPRRQFAYACPDWMEPEPHLGGALGEAILHRLAELGIVQQLATSRAVTINGDLLDWLS